METNCWFRIPFLLSLVSRFLLSKEKSSKVGIVVNPPDLWTVFLLSCEGIRLKTFMK